MIVISSDYLINDHSNPLYPPTFHHIIIDISSHKSYLIILVSPQPLVADHFHQPAVDLPLFHFCLHPEDQDQGQDQGGGDDDNDDEQPG